MRVLYLNVNDEKEPEVIDIEDNLKTYQKLLQCKTVYITRRKIANRYFTIIHDDTNPKGRKVSAISSDNKEVFFGNIVIIADTLSYKWYFISLTDEQIIFLKDKMKPHSVYGNYILTECDY
jgi:hypothetical protein